MTSPAYDNAIIHFMCQKILFWKKHIDKSWVSVWNAEQRVIVKGKRSSFELLWSSCSLSWLPAWLYTLLQRLQQYHNRFASSCLSSTSFLLIIDIDLTSFMRGFQDILKALALASNYSRQLNVKKHCEAFEPYFVSILEQITQITKKVLILEIKKWILGTGVQCLLYSHVSVYYKSRATGQQDWRTDYTVLSGTQVLKNRNVR